MKRLAAAVAGLCATGLLATPALSDTAGPGPAKPNNARQDISGFFSPFPFQTGEAIYTGVCQGCHMPGAVGAVGAGAYPALAKDENLETSAYPVMIVLKGQKAMPGFGLQLNDDQVAQVVNYVRSHFGNRYKDKVSAADVKAMR